MKNFEGSVPVFVVFYGKTDTVKTQEDYRIYTDRKGVEIFLRAYLGGRREQIENVYTSLHSNFYARVEDRFAVPREVKQAESAGSPQEVVDVFWEAGDRTGQAIHE